LSGTLTIAPRTAGRRQSVLDCLKQQFEAPRTIAPSARPLRKTKPSASNRADIGGANPMIAPARGHDFEKPIHTRRSLNPGLL